MKFVLISVGSRGDAEPFCSLAASLLRKHSDCSVHLFLQRDLTKLAPTVDDTNPRFYIHELPFTQQDFYKIVAASESNQGANHPNPRVRFVGIVAECIGDLVLPCYEAVASACDGDDATGVVIVASSLARQLALTVAESRDNCRVALVQLQPLQPVPDFPHYSHTEDCVATILRTQKNTEMDTPHVMPESEAAANLETYWEPERFQHKFIYDRLSKLCDLDFENDIQPALLGDRPNVVVVNAFSNQLAPRVGNAWHVGPLADGYVKDIPDIPKLNSFLKRCTPVCIGYGSMPFDKVSIILNALQEVDRKAVVVGQCFVDAINSTESSDWVNENICAVASVPYPWLLPQCSMILSHGGAGVVNAALRAGIPNVVSPLMGDQMFWGKLLAANDLGVVAGSLPTLTQHDIVNGIVQAESITDAAKRVGEAICQEEALGADLFAERLGSW